MPDGELIDLELTTDGSKKILKSPLIKLLSFASGYLKSKLPPAPCNEIHVKRNLLLFPLNILANLESRRKSSR